VLFCEQFATFQGNVVPSKCQELLAQCHNITSQKTEIPTVQQ